MTESMYLQARANLFYSTHPAMKKPGIYQRPSMPIVYALVGVGFTIFAVVMAIVKFLGGKNEF